VRSDYSIKLTVDGDIRIALTEKFGLCEWEGVYSSEAVMEVTTKTGRPLDFEEFWSLLLRAFEQR
jgi:hypothetical protein